ncbi:hypothetical protein DXG03_002955 [Asterophora parasitica]|uniref:Uncharacterized protein n=1 Tax=Asterophora parasitica TaxID=117018 RepID=A0A9P7K9K6_9AGAR|nr:hypothetical protein DXG03_002955 [Asterophora parasitica]
MSTTHPFVLHQLPKHHYATHIAVHDEPPRKALPPVIPDLRFEHSYLRSIQRYVLRQPSTIGELTEKNGQRPHSSSSNASSQIVDIKWGRVVWITTRDQVISPFLQGALW